MYNSQNAQNSSQMPWWHREKKDSLGQRIHNIQKVNDPTTYTDEVLTASKILLTLLLVFSGVLGALSYFKNFSISFPIEVAIFLALTLTIVIEWGKLKAATWAVRIPFFQGWNSLGHSPSNTFIFLGLVAVAIATFTMSIYNSTKGGEQLATMLSHEKNATTFKPDTREIDAAIANTDKSIANAPMQKWKGKMYYQDAKSVRAQSQSKESLLRQREEAVRNQRADYEAKEARMASQTTFASKLVLASGGWIEVLQILLILLRVACEKNLDGRSSPTPGQAFKSQNGQPVNIANSRPIGFNVANDGNVISVEPEPPSVPQTPTSVAQTNASHSVMSPGEALRWFENELRREPSNLKNRHANAQTVLSRIHNKLDRTVEYLERVDDLPEQAAFRLKTYLNDEFFPIIEPIQPYPNAQKIISLLTVKSTAHGA